LENLISGLADTLSFVFGDSLINQLLSYGITSKGDKFDTWLAFKVGSQLSLNKGALAHSWDTHRHDHDDGLGLMA
jgi:hypothetical protein